MAMTIVSRLESLPTELKHIILQNIPNVKTLSSLVHASPSMHTIYTNHRERIMTQVTINELLSKNINVLTSAPLLEVQVAGDIPKDTMFRQSKSNTNAIHALETLQAQLSASPSSISLDMAQCKVLRDIEHLVEWSLDENFRDGIYPQYIKVPEDESRYWAYAFDEYYVVYLRERRPLDMWTSYFMLREFTDKQMEESRGDCEMRMRGKEDGE